MNSRNSVIIDSKELLQNYKTNRDLIIVDARSGKQGKADYVEQHLAGALHVDLDYELSDIKDDVSFGGRHPLPKIEEFGKLLTDMGISKNSHVVVYDDKNGANAAARFWWMLTAVGHENIQVLNGGIQEALKLGFPTSSTFEIPNKVSAYQVDKWLLPMVNMAEVEKRVKDENYLVIDVRASERYNGATEPIDLIAGHIPGAINVPLSKNLDNKGLFLSRETLNNDYKEITKERPLENIIVHCGSGVTACHTLLAFAHAGLGIPNLYVGSWSEWSRNNKPIGTNMIV